MIASEQRVRAHHDRGRTQAQRCASIDATVAADKDRDNCDPGTAFARRPELPEESYTEYRDEYVACFARMERTP